MKSYWSQWCQFTNLFAVFLLSSGTMDQLTVTAVSVISRRPCTSGQDFHNKIARTGDDVYITPSKEFHRDHRAEGDCLN